MAASCAALLKGVLDGSQTKDLFVEWDDERRAFDLKVRIHGANSSETLDEYAKTIPLRIAERSNCDCGDSLTLGGYTMESKYSDFIFNAEYFCASCQT